MNAIELIIKLKTPLLIAGVHLGDENSRNSLDYIPGSTIKGAVIKQFLTQKRITDQDMQDDNSEVRKLFFSSQLRYLNAYPYNDKFSGHPRSLPVPFSWYVEKRDKERQNDTRIIHDFCVRVTDMDQPKNEPRRFFWQPEQTKDETDHSCALMTPRMISSVHNMSVLPHIKSSENSTVFRYEVLAANQTFCAFILSEDETMLEELDNWVPEGSVFLGGSRTARYGHVVVQKQRVENWTEVDHSGIKLSSEITISLLSDVILRADTGEPTYDLTRALNKELKGHFQLTLTRSFVKTGTVGAFNRKWGLPTLQDQVILKGSSFVYHCDPQCDFTDASIQKLMTTGIGERLSDGFGRIGINLNSYEEFGSYSPDLEQYQRTELTTESQNLAARMAARHIDACVDDAILKYLQSIRFNKDRQPENAQLNKLRTLAREAMRNPADQSLGIKSFVNNLREDAFLQFDRRHLIINEKKFTWRAWLEGLINNHDGVAALNLEQAAWEILGQEFPPDDTEKARIAYKIIDAVVTRAVKNKE